MDHPEANTASPGAGTSQRGGQGSSQRGGNQGAGAIQKDAFRIYCHKKYHKQKDCRSRIRDKISLTEEENLDPISDDYLFFFHTAY